MIAGFDAGLISDFVQHRDQAFEFLRHTRALHPFAPEFHQFDIAG